MLTVSNEGSYISTQTIKPGRVDEVKCRYIPGSFLTLMTVSCRGEQGIQWLLVVGWAKTIMTSM